jgi:predicted small secreted protein
MKIKRRLLNMKNKILILLILLSSLIFSGCGNQVGAGSEAVKAFAGSVSGVSAGSSNSPSSYNAELILKTNMAIILEEEY